MGSRRTARIASRIRFLVSSIIQRELSDPRVGFTTILRVEPTEDFKEAKVYFSVLGDSSVRSRTLHAIEQASGFIQKEVGKSLKTRNTPRLRFILDQTQDKISRFESLLEKAVQEDQEIHDTQNPQENQEKGQIRNRTKSLEAGRLQGEEDREEDSQESCAD